MKSARYPPVLIAGLTVMWLLLTQSVAPGQILLGLVLATALARATYAIRRVQPRIRHAYLLPKLVALVLMDIVRSNLGVARIVLGLVGERRIRSGFVDVPLDLHDPHGLAVLAAIVTSTPGTVWVDLAPDGSRATLHVLDLRDEAEWIDWIKNRYEKLLMRIFQ